MEANGTLPRQMRSGGVDTAGLNSSEESLIIHHEDVVMKAWQPASLQLSSGVSLEAGMRTTNDMEL